MKILDKPSGIKLNTTNISIKKEVEIIKNELRDYQLHLSIKAVEILRNKKIV
jgi:hypothetical protein